LAHVLSPQTAMIWRLCDGQRTIEDIADELAVADEAVVGTIQELFAVQLLDGSPKKTPTDGEGDVLSRRSMLTQGAAAALVAVPGVVTTAIPAAAQTLSRVIPGQGEPCRGNSGCGSPPGANGLCCYDASPPLGVCCPPDPSNPVIPARGFPSVCRGAVSRRPPRGGIGPCDPRNR
jgi:hypothetical protein